MLRRAPSGGWLSDNWHAEVNKIDDCIDCGACVTRCPYKIKILELLRKNLADYRDILAVKVRI